MRNALAFAWRSVRAAPARGAVLVVALAVTAFLPIFTYLAAGRIERTLLRRAERTPIVVGAAGNEFDLTMSSLYFRGSVAGDLRAAEARAVADEGYGLVVPLLVRYRAAGAPLVGTTLDYFEQRALRPAKGRLPAVLGEAVIGAGLARRLGTDVGEAVRSDLSNLYNLAGAYPVLLRVVGVLAPNGTADDDVWFTDLKTTWAIEGRLHGHEPVTREQALTAAQRGTTAPGAAGERDEAANLEASAALFLFSEISPENLASFHLHGDPGDAPLSSLLVFPKDRRAHDQLLGDFALAETRQAVRPVMVVRAVLEIVFRVRDGLRAYFAAVALATVLLFALVVVMSLRLRERELGLLRRLGASRGAIALMVAVEIGLLAALAAVLVSAAAAGGLALLSARLGV